MPLILMLKNVFKLWIDNFYLVDVLYLHYKNECVMYFDKLKCPLYISYVFIYLIVLMQAMILRLNRKQML